jgi:molybdopterin converting factor small subunit
MAIGEEEMQGSGIGHNSREITLKVEARFFNSLAEYCGPDGPRQRVTLEAGGTVGDLIRMFRLPIDEIFLVLRNGRDVTPGVYRGGYVNEDAVLDDGDVIAFSGPVPYSFGYGAPVV